MSISGRASCNFRKRVVLRRTFSSSDDNKHILFLILSSLDSIYCDSIGGSKLLANTAQQNTSSYFKCPTEHQPARLLALVIVDMMSGRRVQHLDDALTESEIRTETGVGARLPRLAHEMSRDQGDSCSGNQALAEARPDSNVRIFDEASGLSFKREGDNIPRRSSDEFVTTSSMLLLICAVRTRRIEVIWRYRLI